jgi:hypothetical protein
MYFSMLRASEKENIDKNSMLKKMSMDGHFYKLTKAL